MTQCRGARSGSPESALTGYWAHSCSQQTYYAPANHARSSPRNPRSQTTSLLCGCAGTVDVSQAGEGQLEIMVNRGMVKNSVRSLGKGLFTVSFVPRDTRPHLVDISFNGEPIPRA